MKVFTSLEMSPEIIKTIEAGYTHEFTFIESNFQSLSDPHVCYHTSLVKKFPIPCLISQLIVYRITTIEGIKGFAVLHFNQDEEMISHSDIIFINH